MPFDRHEATPKQLRRAAEECEDVVAGLLYVRARGHLELPSRVDALKVVSALRDEIDWLKARARLKETPAINKESA